MWLDCSGIVMDDSCYSGEEAFSILGIFWDVMRQSNRNFDIPPPPPAGQTPGIWLFSVPGSGEFDG